MPRKDRPIGLKFPFLLGFTACLACAVWLATPSPSCAQTPGASSPDRKIELSTRDLPPEVREMLLRLNEKNKQEKYWKKRAKMETWGKLLLRKLDYISAEYDQGYDYLMAGKYDQAIAEFNKIIQSNSREGEAYINRGLAYAYKCQYDRALADFTAFINLDANDSEAYYNRGLAYALKGRYGKALPDFNKALALNPRDAQAYYLRGFVYYKQGEADRARSDYQKALKLAPDFVRQAAAGKSELDTYGLRLQGKVTKPPRAEVGARKAEAAHKRHGLTLARQDQYDRAISEFTQALAIDPQDVETFNNRGSIYTLKGQYDAAMADFTKALSLNPRYAKAYYNRALAYYYQGKYDQAINDLTKAIELKPKDVASYNNRGLAYMQQGNYERAIDDFNVATILNPKLADAYFNKAVSCEKAGRQDEALEAYELFIRYAPAEAKARLKEARRKLR
jgi:tetratricopeptide (TPR) repeat protein